MDESTIPARFLRLARSLRGKVAISDGERQLRYIELVAASTRMSEHIRNMTRKPNVGIMLPNGIGFAVAFFGAALAGKAAVPVNFLLNTEEILRIFADAGVDTVLTTSLFAGNISGALPNVVCMEEQSFNEPSGAFAPPQVSPDDVAALLYTSGTIYRPKGVMQTHANLLSNIDACLRAMEIQEKDVFLAILPTFHTFGLTCVFLLPLLTGGRVHFVQRFIPAAVVREMRESGATIFMGVPSMYKALLKSFGEGNSAAGGFPSLRLCVSGGEALPVEIGQKFQAQSGVAMCEGYGMTETSPVISLNRAGRAKWGTVGQALDNLEVGIFDDDGRRLKSNADGEIWVKGPSVMKGYWGLPAETAEILTKDGWLKTGDMGQIDEDGYIKITGRKKEMIISAGKNIYPVEIERTLEEHPHVFEAAVIGVADEVRGEAPVAFVVPVPGAEVNQLTLFAHCKERLAAFKVPKKIHVVKELPHTLTGKVLKRALRSE
jgi:long-chain acyl-CoA synthetase